MIPIEVKRMLEVIERDGKKKLSDIRKSTNQEVKNILKEGEEECKKIKKRILEDCRRRAKMLKRKGAADIEIKRRELLKKVKSDMVKTLKDDAVKMIRKRGYEKFLTVLLERGIKEIGKKGLKVYINKNDVPYVKKFLRRKGIKGEVKSIKTSGGCMLSSGKITANYLIESLMERKEREIDKVVNNIFFKG